MSGSRLTHQGRRRAAGGCGWRLHRAQKPGDVDPTPKPRNVVLAMLGMVSWYTAAPQISRMLVDRPEDPKVIAAHRATLVELARRMLAVP